MREKLLWKIDETMSAIFSLFFKDKTHLLNQVSLNLYNKTNELDKYAKNLLSSTFLYKVNKKLN